MKDPTYIIEEIEQNPIYLMAWIMSEWFNDNAPIGWSNYIPTAESINNKLNVSIKEI